MGIDGFVICQLGQYFFGQLFTELDSPLIEAKYVPDHKLNKNFMLIHGD